MRWQVVRDETAGSRPNVLAQTDQDPTSYRFPVCVFDAVSATDVDVSVRFKPISGGAGEPIRRISERPPALSRTPRSADRARLACGRRRTR